MGGQAALRSGYYHNLASVQNSYNRSYNCGCNGLGLANFMSTAMMAMPLIMAGGSLLNGILGGIGARRAASAGAGNGSSSVKPNSVFTFGNDYKTDYAEKAVSELNAELEKVNNSIKTKTDRKNLLSGSESEEGSVKALEKASNDLKTEHTTLTGDLKTLTTDYDQKTNDLGLELGKKAEDQDASKIARLRNDIKQIEKDIEEKNESIKENEDKQKTADDALKNAKDELAKLPDEIAELEKTQKLIQNKIKEYETLDYANGTADLRATSKVANDKNNIQNNTFELNNARQLINEFASAKRAYEANPNNIVAKKNLKKVADQFITEYTNGKGNGVNATIDNAYKLIKDYVENMDKKHSDK